MSPALPVAVAPVADAAGWQPARGGSAAIGGSGPRTGGPQGGPQQHSRELRTTDATPSAPRLDVLFGRELPTPAQTLLVWDPAGSWPLFSMGTLVGAAGDLHDVRLRREGQVEPLVSVHHTRIATAEGELGVMLVVAPPADPTSMRLALALLEQADRAVILAGSAFDADLQRRVRIQRTGAGAAWQGPPVILAAPADKPSRGQRLRRLDWPADLRTEVVDLPRHANPHWTRQFIEQIRCRPLGGRHGAPASTGRHAADRPTHAPLTAPVAAPRSTINLTVGPATASAGVLEPAAARIDEALSLIEATPGVCGAAWLGRGAAGQRVLRGAMQGADNAAVGAVEALWDFAAPRTGTSALESLDWQTADHHHAVVPVGQPITGLLLAIADRRFGDVAQLRWQLVVARNALG